MVNDRMNRHDRRAAGKGRIPNTADASYASLRAKMIREKAERDATELGPEECRRRLAEWASQPGRTQEEIDALNAPATWMDQMKHAYPVKH